MPVKRKKQFKLAPGESLEIVSSEASDEFKIGEGARNVAVNITLTKEEADILTEMAWQRRIPRATMLREFVLRVLANELEKQSGKESVQH